MSQETRIPPWSVVSGTVQQGYQVASGKGRESPYPEGSIKLQMPFFAALGLDLSEFYPGTLNLSIAPYQFAMRQPEYTFRQVQWTTLHPPEDFSFSRCYLEFQRIRYDGWVYYPHPETKRTHFQNASLLEVLAPRIEAVQYGDRLLLWLNLSEIQLINPEPI